MRATVRLGMAAILAVCGGLWLAGCDDGGGSEGDVVADVTQPDADVTQPDADVTQPDADVAQPDADAAQPDADAAQPDADVTQPDADAAQPDATDTGEVPPVSGPELLTWLQAGNYAAWASESSAHESGGPHFGQVRVFINPILAASLAAGDATYPKGAAAVKELFGETATATASSWSVWVKTDADSNGGLSTYWYEIFDGSVFANAKGALICTDCHAGGADFLLTSYPLQ
ncbi:MAG: hypothetical protein R3F39_04280 [Myxococcota bacterium]